MGQTTTIAGTAGRKGPTDDPDVLRLRRRLMRSAIAILLTSQGVPLFHMGDEVAHTKQGNNNTYGHDNELTGSTGTLAKRVSISNASFNI